MENNSFLCVSCHDNDTAAVTLSDEGQLHLSFSSKSGKSPRFVKLWVWVRNPVTAFILKKQCIKHLLSKANVYYIWQNPRSF